MKHITILLDVIIFRVRSSKVLDTSWRLWIRLTCSLKTRRLAQWPLFLSFLSTFVMLTSIWMISNKLSNFLKRLLFQVISALFASPRNLISQLPRIQQTKQSNKDWASFTWVKSTFTSKVFRQKLLSLRNLDHSKMPSESTIRPSKWLSRTLAPITNSLRS